MNHSPEEIKSSLIRIWEDENIFLQYKENTKKSSGRINVGKRSGNTLRSL